MERIIRGANASAVRRGRNENCARVRKCDEGRKGKKGSCPVARAKKGESRQFDDDGKIDSDSVCTQKWKDLGNKVKTASSSNSFQNDE